jgi:methylglutamate dehydrogenase subunit D
MSGQPANPRVSVDERADVSQCSVIARKGAGASLIDRVRAELSLDLPHGPRTSGPGLIEFVWIGVNQWLAVSNGYDGSALEQRLSLLLRPLAALADQSDGRSIIRVSGPGARDTLAKGVDIDLHPRVFKSGDAASTVIGHINVHLWQIDDGPTYNISVFRSFAIALCDWLRAATAECDGT